MLEIINQLIDLGPVYIITVIVLLILLIPLIVKSWGELLNALGLETKKSIKQKEKEEEMRQIKQDFEDYQNKIYDKQQEYHQQSIDIRNGLIDNQHKLESNQKSLSDDVKTLTNMLQLYIEKDNRRTIASLRTTLWRLHADFVAQGYITPDGLKTFNELGAVYEEAGGDDIYHSKLLPEIMDLEIHYPDGSIYKK